MWISPTILPRLESDRVSILGDEIQFVQEWQLYSTGNDGNDRSRYIYHPTESLVYDHSCRRLWVVLTPWLHLMFCSGLEYYHAVVSSYLYTSDEPYYGIVCHEVHAPRILYSPMFSNKLSSDKGICTPTSLIYSLTTSACCWSPNVLRGRYLSTRETAYSVYVKGRCSRRDAMSFERD